MARPYRLQGEDCFYHITSRGNHRKPIYYQECDYEKFLEYLSMAKRKYKFRIYAYALMTNHYHLLIQTLAPNLSRVMQYLNTAYTVYFNRKRIKSGHLFQGRFKSIVVDIDSYFLELTKYIHLNPVRAKMVEDPVGYKWSSYGAYLSLKDNDKGVVDKEYLRGLGVPEPSEYRKFVLGGIGEGDKLLSNVYAGFAMGKERFIKEKLNQLREQIETKECSYRKEILRGQNTADSILVAISKYYGVKEEALLKRQKKISKQRKLAIYALKSYTSCSNREIGDIFGVSYTAVSKAFRGIEEIALKDKRVRRDIAVLNSQFKV